MAAVRILAATANPAKAKRLRWCFRDWPIAFDGPEELPGFTPPEEEGVSHREVAESKARVWSEAHGGLALASDGGLLIPALGDRWDSLRTRRSAGEDATDEDRIQHLLRLMAPYSGEERQALWHEAMTLADNGDVLAVWETRGPVGYVLREPSPVRIEGFWAASLWHFPQFGKTFTEMNAEELEQAGAPWSRLSAQVQDWLRDGGWGRLQEAATRRAG